MSYADLNEEQLREIADMYAVDVDENDDEQSLVNKVSTLNVAEVLLDFPQFADQLALPAEEDDEDEFDEDDEAPALITSSSTPKKGVAKKAAAKKAVAKKAAPAKAAAKTVVPEDRTLIKMTRNNPVYEVRGYRFTRIMPFVFVKNEDVDFLCEVEGGFTVAKPSEVEKFFG